MRIFLEQLCTLRKEVVELTNPSLLESELLNYYFYIRTKRSERCKKMSSVARADKILKIIGKRGKSSASFFMTLSMREVDKKKPTDDQHLKKCHTALEYLQKAKESLIKATENEKILFKKVEKLVQVLVVVQRAPEDY